MAMHKLISNVIKRARRPIPVDQNLVRKLARGLYDAIKLQTRDLDLYEPFGRKRYVWSTNFRFKDVRGTNRGATVTLIQEPIPGSSAGRVFRGTPLTATVMWGCLLPEGRNPFTNTAAALSSKA